MLKLKAIGISRLKVYVSRTHPLQADEMESLKDLRTEGYPDPYLFVGERGGHLKCHAVTSLVNRCAVLDVNPIGDVATTKRRITPQILTV